MFDGPVITSPALTTLRDAREWLSDPAHWCKGVLAIGPHGHVTDLLTGDVRATCLIGAIMKVRRAAGAGYSRSVRLLENECAAERPGIAISEYNDAAITLHADVLRVLDAAIAAEERKLSHRADGRRVKGKNHGKSIRGRSGRPADARQ